MSNDAIELCRTLATYPEWMQSAEKRLMISKMAARIVKEHDVKKCIIQTAPKS